MHFAAEVGGDKEVALVETPGGEFEIETRDHRYPLDHSKPPPPVIEAENVFIMNKASLTEIDWSRLASWLDSDGTLSMRVQERDAKTYYNPRVAIYNSNFRIIQWLLDHFGGTYHEFKRQVKPNHKKQYMWLMAAENMVEILQKTLPHMLLKQEQAAFIIRFYKEKPAERALSPEETARQGEIHKAVSALNQRGLTKEDDTRTHVQIQPEDIKRLSSLDEAGIRGGIHSKRTYLMALHDGSLWVWKQTGVEERDEIFVYELAQRMFRKIVPEVQPVFVPKLGWGSAMRKVAGVPAGRVDGLHGYFHGNDEMMADLVAMLVLDFMTGNPDRHSNNWFIMHNDRLAAIDNGWAGEDLTMSFADVFQPARLAGMMEDERLWPQLLKGINALIQDLSGRGDEVRALAEAVKIDRKEAVEMVRLWEPKLESMAKLIRSEAGRVEKARTYVRERTEAPPGTPVEEGPRGGLYYETKPQQGIPHAMRAFEDEIRNDEFESAMIITPKGTVLEEKTNFLPNMVGFNIYDIEGGVYRGAIMSHNHPSGSSFSDDDLAISLRAGMSEVRVVGSTSNEWPYYFTFRLRIEGGYDEKRSNRAMAAVHNSHVKVRSTFMKAIDKKILTTLQADRLHWRVVWKLARRELAANGVFYEAHKHKNPAYQPVSKALGKAEPAEGPQFDLDAILAIPIYGPDARPDLFQARLEGLAAWVAGGKIEKARVYIEPGTQPPLGTQVETGPRGGTYYESEDIPAGMEGQEPPSVEEFGPQVLTKEALTEAEMFNDGVFQPWVDDYSEGQGDPGEQKIRQDLKNDIVLRLSGATGIDYDLVNDYVKSWAASSSTHRRSVMMQQAAAEMFGLEMNQFIRDARPYYPDEAERLRDSIAASKIVKAMYDDTQAWLKEQGVKSLVLFRGMRWTEEDVPVSPHEISSGADIDFHANPLSSWSSDPVTANEFANMQAEGGESELDYEDPNYLECQEKERDDALIDALKWKRQEDAEFDEEDFEETFNDQYDYGMSDCMPPDVPVNQIRAIAVAKVPADRIIALSVTGLGCLNEQEVVVAGGKQSVRMYGERTEGEDISYHDFIEKEPEPEKPKTAQEQQEAQQKQWFKGNIDPLFDRMTQQQRALGEFYKLKVKQVEDAGGDEIASQDRITDLRNEHWELYHEIEADAMAEGKKLIEAAGYIPEGGWAAAEEAPMSPELAAWRKEHYAEWIDENLEPDLKKWVAERNDINNKWAKADEKLRLKEPGAARHKKLIKLMENRNNALLVADGDYFRLGAKKIREAGFEPQGNFAERERLDAEAAA